MVRLAMVTLLVLLGCSGTRSESSTGGGGGQPPGTPDEVAPDVAPPNNAEVAPEPGSPGADFERFVLTGDETPCPRQARGDCHSVLELLADGTLRLDPWGEPGAAVLEARVLPDALRAAVAAVRAQALLDLLARPKPCADANGTESMLVRVAGADHRNETGYCNEDAIQSARRAAIDLASAHFADHSLISPPF